MSIWRGNSAPPLVWALPDDIPITGSDFFLTIGVSGSVLLSRDTASGTLTLNSALRQLEWDYSAAESRLIPEGQIARYEIERHAGSVEITEIYGPLTGLGGLNPDASPGMPAELDFSNPDNSGQQMMGWA